MFQTFEATTSPDQGPPRLSALRAEMARDGVAGFLVPRADAHQGEYVAPADERLSWLTGFTGSAGFCAVLADMAGIFVDGRYRVQVRAQTADVFTPVNWPETKLGPWLAERLTKGDRVAFDPWLHTKREIDGLDKVLTPIGVSLKPSENLVDRIWEDRPAAPSAPAFAHPIELSGQRSPEKREAIAELLREAGQKAAVLTLPDSIAWLLNIRGGDIPRTPVMHGFAILHETGRVSLFVDPKKVEALGPDPDIDILPPAAFLGALADLEGPVRVDKASAPYAVSAALEDAGVAIAWGDDPCALPKAKKNSVELAGVRAAHDRDAVAMVQFLAWLDAEAPKGGLTEIDVVKTLEAFRRETNALHDISFETIAGAGPNGAIVHYRVTDETNRKVAPGELLLVDSGGQYVDGTTDITRTVAIGPPGGDEIAAFTRVLQGMIAVSRLRWPRGLAGRDLDAVARAPLWMAGQDYDHGTGHGVGAFLSVHEGPQRLSRISEVPLEEGMILSNEPGYYREGVFGIRIENLVVVTKAPEVEGGDGRDQLAFETLTWVPIDTRLIDVGLLSPGERDWLNAYHAEVRAKLNSQVSGHAADWLEASTQPI